MKRWLPPIEFRDRALAGFVILCLVAVAVITLMDAPFWPH
jgi:hypothetical protein